MSSSVLRKLGVVLVIGCTTLAAVGASFTRYVVWEHEAASQLLWNAKEAYVFVGTVRSGWHGNLLQYQWQVLRNLVGLTVPPTERRPSVTVFRVSKDDVQRHVANELLVSSYYVSAGGIYGTGRGGLIRWNGAGFDAVRESERAAVEANRIEVGQFSEVEGWSKRQGVLNRAFGKTEFPVQIGGSRAVFVATVDYPGTSKTLALHRPDQPPSQLWSLDTTPRIVSAEEYRAFLEAEQDESGESHGAVR